MSTSGTPTEHYLDRGVWLDYHLTADAPVRFHLMVYPDAGRVGVDFHEGIEVGVLLRGAQERSFEDYSFQVGRGDVWLCASWEPHGWRVVEAGTTAAVAIFLPGFLGDEMLGRHSWLDLLAAPPRERPRVGTPMQATRVLTIGYEWETEWYQGTTDWAPALRLDLLRLLFTLSRDWLPATGASRAPGAAALARIMPALRLVHASPTRQASIVQAAAACGLSRAQFCLVFRRVMGMTFGDFRTRARLGLVAQRLLDTDASVQAIADAVGFCDPSHLHRSFTRHYGCTPGEFRERGRAGGSSAGLHT